jgi:hypothetical protein
VQAKECQRLLSVVAVAVFDSADMASYLALTASVSPNSDSRKVADCGRSSIAHQKRAR